MMTITLNYVVRMRNQTKSYKINLSLSALSLFILSVSKLSEPSVRLLGHLLLGVPGWVCQVQVVPVVLRLALPWTVVSTTEES